MNVRVLLTLAFLLAASEGVSEDWPEWRGRGRLGVWTETGIIEAFPEKGLDYTWRTPLRGGYAGPSVADGRVFVTDYQASDGMKGTERALALDEKTGEILWVHEWPVDYAGLAPTYAIGPRATPTVDGERVYALGAMGALWCFDVASGAVRWKKDYVRDYDTRVPTWGITGAPIVEGDLIIGLVGGRPDALVVAFDKTTGREAWRSLPTKREPGYAQPVIFDVGSTRQLIIWHPTAITSLEPATGKVFWEVPFEVGMGSTVATPVLAGRHLLVSAFFDGSVLLELAEDEQAARVVWRVSGPSEVDSEGLHALITTPVIDGDWFYGIGSYGELRGLELATGRRLWDSLEPVGERARWAAAFIVPHGNRHFINNDRGELILADLTPDGYREIDRTPLIAPTSRANRRELGVVNWSHPAYANGHIVARNDEEIVRADLRAPESTERR
jgi:outer membrane protein assembly factor BamB